MKGMGVNSLVHHLSKQSTLSIATKEHFRNTNGLRNRTPSSQLFHFISLAILGTVTNINLIPIFADAKAIPRVYLCLTSVPIKCIKCVHSWRHSLS